MTMPEQPESANLSFRPIEAADEAFLCTVYASTRADEMALLTHWTDAQKTAFLTQQFQAQHAYYHSGIYPGREFLIILCDNRPAGRLYLDHRPQEIRIVDITLLPDFRGRGLGERLLRAILTRAAAANQVVTIHVERMNRARHLYDRLGFRIIDESNAVYLLMEWRSPSLQTANR